MFIIFADVKSLLTKPAKKNKVNVVLINFDIPFGAAPTMSTMKGFSDCQPEKRAHVQGINKLGDRKPSGERRGTYATHEQTTTTTFRF